MPERLPTLFLSHGGGPCFFLPPGQMFPHGTWDQMSAHLQAVGDDVGHRPKALLIVSAHWEERMPTTYAPIAPSLLYDYYGFPQSSYSLRYPALGDPETAAQARALLDRAGFRSGEDRRRGFDHGVFIPMKLAYPEANIPIVQLSLCSSLDAVLHLKIGKALAPLRDEGVLIVGSGMSYHNLSALGSPKGNASAAQFDNWLNGVVTAADAAERTRQLEDWQSAPAALQAHPRAEHLAPLFVAAGAAGEDLGAASYRDMVFGKAVSSFRFG